MFYFHTYFVLTEGFGSFYIVTQVTKEQGILHNYIFVLLPLFFGRC